MKMRLKIDSAGRVAIPTRLREKLRLEAGDSLDLESTGDQITLRPVRGASPLIKEHCVWMLRTGHPLPVAATDEMLEQVRRERDLQNLGTLE